MHKLLVADGAPRILCVSQSTLALMRNPVVSQRSKRMDVLHHWERARAGRNEIVLDHCSTKTI
jgi:hypothetical protein